MRPTRFGNLVHSEAYVPAPGALTGNQAVETSADQIHHSNGKNGVHWFAPIVADAEAGFGGNLNAFELMKAMIEAGAAAVHFADQSASARKCGHMGGKVAVPIREFIQKLTAARLAADIAGVPTILAARTDANSAGLLLNDIDPRDREFITGERTPEGFFQFRGGLDAAIARGLAYATYADIQWCETSEPNIREARRFAEGVHVPERGVHAGKSQRQGMRRAGKPGRRYPAGGPTGGAGVGAGPGAGPQKPARSEGLRYRSAPLL